MSLHSEASGKPNASSVAEYSRFDTALAAGWNTVLSKEISSIWTGSAVRITSGVAVDSGVMMTSIELFCVQAATRKVISKKDSVDNVNLTPTFEISEVFFDFLRSIKKHFF